MPPFADSAHRDSGNFDCRSRMVTRVENNIADKLAAIPGVTSVGFAALAPMEEVGTAGVTFMRRQELCAVIRRCGSSTTSLLAIFRPWAHVWWQDAISPGTKSTTFGYKVIVSENLAREEWGGADAAIGKRIQQGSWSALVPGDRRGPGSAAERRRSKSAGDRLLAGLDCRSLALSRLAR